ncbi:DUF6044 family protein [Leptospira noguchii]|uniref:DUF6044 family protein n=1 Tax=Leptospira noguchii TaxID=28182 RepID=UPI001F5FB2C7|nr:DUF6044 family protein [Leptospira noguchii]
MQEFIPLLFIFIISLFFIFSSFRGEKSYNRYHDNGDGWIPFQIKFFVDVQNHRKPMLFDPSMLGGNDRNSESFTNKPISWLFVFFKPWTASYLIIFLQTFLGSVGIYLLLRFRFFCSKTVAAIASLFFLKPLFEISELLSVSLVPIIVFFITKEKIKVYYVLLLALLYSFLSSTVLALYTFPLTLFLALVIRFSFEKFKNQFFQFVSFYIIFELINIVPTLKNAISSHRSDWAWDIYGKPSFNTSFIYGINYENLLILLYFILGLILIKSQKYRIVIYLMFFFFLSHLFILLSGWVYYFAHLFGIKISSFNLLRVYLQFPIIVPILWGLIFEEFRVVLRVTQTNWKQFFKDRKAYILVSLCIFPILLSFYQSYRNFDNRRKSKDESFKIYNLNALSFFREMISKDVTEFRAISLGIDPAISTSAGFETLDGYSNLYPKAYKRYWLEFTDLENISPYYFRYYNDWGNRVYTFISPNQFHLNENLAILGNLKYVFSSEILINTRLKPVFDYGIYVYEISNPGTRFYFSKSLRFFNTENDLYEAVKNCNTEEVKKTTFLLIKDRKENFTNIQDDDVLSVERINSDTYEIIRSGNGEAMLNVSISYSKNWKAISDNNQELNVYPANGPFMAVRLQKGIKKVKLIYKPDFYNPMLYLL